MGRGTLSRGQAHRSRASGKSVLCSLSPSLIQVWTADFYLGPWAFPGQALPSQRLGESFSRNHSCSLNCLRENSMCKAGALSPAQLCSPQYFLSCQLYPGFCPGPQLAACGSSFNTA